MHPEMSLVFLTLISGIGQGIFILLFFLEIFFPGLMSWEHTLASLITVIVLQYIGSLASLFHLGNPQRFIKALKMWKHSWLSREAITLSAFTGLIHIYLILTYFKFESNYLHLVGALCIVYSLAFFVSSAMLYAVIRFIKEWANGFTPVNFFLSGLMGGLALSLCLSLVFDPNSKMVIGSIYLLLGIVFLGLIVKVMTFRHNHNIYAGITLKHALGVNDPDIVQMDMGTPYEHYNTKEFYYPMSEKMMGLQEKLILIISFVIPLIVLYLLKSLIIPMSLQLPIAIIMSLSMIAGLILDRRLFFITGNHLQNHYYGNFRYNRVKNPLLIKAKKGTPVP